MHRRPVWVVKGALVPVKNLGITITIRSASNLVVIHPCGNNAVTIVSFGSLDPRVVSTSECPGTIERLLGCRLELVHLELLWTACACEEGASIHVPA